MGSNASDYNVHMGLHFPLVELRLTGPTSAHKRDFISWGNAYFSHELMQLPKRSFDKYNTYRVRVGSNSLRLWGIARFLARF